MSLLVAMKDWETSRWVARFHTFLPHRRIVTLDEPFDRREVHYVASWKHPPGSLAGLPNLAAIFSLGAGVDHVMSDPRLPDVPIVRVVDADLTQRMSEYVVLHCLMHLRQTRLYAAQQREGVWRDDRDQPAAGDVRVGIMGLGVLGGDAARKLKAIGFDVAGWSRSRKSLEGIATFAGEEGLEQFLARTDILVSLLPLTDVTRGILNKRLFAKLAQDGRLGGAVLINAGRGGLQVEADILRALDDGTLKAVTLDVFETEPLPAGSPLWRHPAVTITPHNAAISEPNAICARIADQIRRLEAGEPLDNLVDREVGY
ncbi:MAG TPA: glyoxylate/hydroxypyruvate reductase A [Beijerinckiaceae bacterium]|nr:glyoxylate/hydroxypyruvate reductase A [Beijerinckiaceae bacterium]